jgi:hypothetical protein
MICHDVQLMSRHRIGMVTFLTIDVPLYAREGLRLLNGMTRKSDCGSVSNETSAVARGRT